MSVSDGASLDPQIEAPVPFSDPGAAEQAAPQPPSGFRVGGLAFESEAQAEYAMREMAGRMQAITEQQQAEQARIDADYRDRAYHEALTGRDLEFVERINRAGKTGQQQNVAKALLDFVREEIAGISSAQVEQRISDAVGRQQWEKRELDEFYRTREISDLHDLGKQALDLRRAGLSQEKVVEVLRGVRQSGYPRIMQAAKSLAAEDLAREDSGEVDDRNSPVDMGKWQTIGHDTWKEWLSGRGGRR